MRKNYKKTFPQAKNVHSHVFQGLAKLLKLNRVEAIRTFVAGIPGFRRGERHVVGLLRRNTPLNGFVLY